MVGELVKAQTEDGVSLNAFYSTGNKELPLLIHIHGYAGTFFGNQFVHEIGNEVVQNGFGFLTIETRGSYGTHGFPVYGKGYRTMGGDQELLEESYLDLDAWIQFALNLGYKSVVLQGHSSAMFKILRYFSAGKYVNKVMKLVFLAPFDKEGALAFHNPDWRACLTIAKAELAAGRGAETIPVDWKGQGLSYQTFVSWYTAEPSDQAFSFYLDNYHSTLLQSFVLPIHVLVGDEDEYFSLQHKGHYEVPFEQLMGQLQKGSGMLLPKTRHSFRGNEKLVAESVLTFLKS